MFVDNEYIEDNKKKADVCINSFTPFLKTGTTLAIFQISGNVDV
jgi:hypothetical protein